MSEVSAATSAEQRFQELQQRLHAIQKRAEQMGSLAERYKGPGNRRTEEKNQAELKETLDSTKKEIAEAKAALEAISSEFHNAVSEFQKQSVALQAVLADKFAKSLKAASPALSEPEVLQIVSFEAPKPDFGRLGVAEHITEANVKDLEARYDELDRIRKETADALSQSS